MRTRAVLWDVDGTLIDSPTIVYLSLEQALGALGHLEWLDEARRLAMHCTSDALLRAIGFTDTEEPLRVWGEYYFALMSTDLYSWYPEAEEAVQRLHALGVKQAIVTSRVRSEIEHDVLLQRRIDCFSAVVGGDDTLQHKPSPEPTRLALARLGVTPEEAVFVGDSPSDEGSAGAAGVRFISAVWGNYVPGSVSEAPDAPRTPSELVERLMRDPVD